MNKSDLEQLAGYHAKRFFRVAKSIKNSRVNPNGKEYVLIYGGSEELRRRFRSILQGKISAIEPYYVVNSDEREHDEKAYEINLDEPIPEDVLAREPSCR